MTATGTGIFVSYRRDDAPGEAGHLAADLARHFGNGDVFLDVATIQPGTDFKSAIDNAVRNAAVVLVVIGRDWLTVTNAHGQRRLDDRDDFVRLEVAAALLYQKPLIPVLVRGATMPAVEDLPDN